MESVVNNHGFADGNKRTAVVLLGVFLVRNGFEWVATNAELTDCVLRLARGKLTLTELTEWFEQTLRETD